MPQIAQCPAEQLRVGLDTTPLAWDAGTAPHPLKFSGRAKAGVTFPKWLSHKVV